MPKNEATEGLLRWDDLKVELNSTQWAVIKACSYNAKQISFIVYITNHWDEYQKRKGEVTGGALVACGYRPGKVPGRHVMARKKHKVWTAINVLTDPTLPKKTEPVAQPESKAAFQAFIWDRVEKALSADKDAIAMRWANMYGQSKGFVKSEKSEIGEEETRKMSTDRLKSTLRRMMLSLGAPSEEVKETLTVRSDATVA